jgi:predicted RNA binding protein YcfA (HicA-like mRNA interferase family)
VSKLRNISGIKCIKILCKQFGFQVIRRKGSHIILSKETAESKTGTVVPAHKELKIGTLKGILELAKVKEEEFSRFL